MTLLLMIQYPQKLLLLVLLYLTSGLAVGGPDFFQLDLFESLHLHNSTYQGVSLGLGINTISPGVIFTGDFRNMMMTGDWIDKIRAQLASVGATEFTISTIVKQNPNNVGTLLAFSKGLLSALEIQSSGRKNELRVISGSTVETFPYRLADGSWHRLALSFSASQVEVIIDCSLTYRRVLKFDPATAIFDSRNISIWIGQKTTSHFLYQGVMQDLRLTFGPYGYLSQCPQMDSQCPTCSDFTALKSSFATLQSKILELTERLTRAESRLSNVEECECQKSCRVNETTTLNDGTTWQDKCEICSCKSGEISCRPIECNPTNCKNPSKSPGECCPTCLKNCYYGGKNYDHGEKLQTRNCVDCECLNGSMQCKRRDPCPPLHCDPSEQIQVPGECCKICPGTDYCALHGSQCHSNATCVNLQTTFACQCHEGFTGDGFKSCEDQNECLLGRHHCGVNTECSNTQGGYICNCLPGFKKLNEFQCTDIDECENSYEDCKSAAKSNCEESKDEICEDDCGSKNLHKCHTYSTCTNIKGSYTCSCAQNYTGDGFHCSPICNRTCENGGLCIAPGLCSCRPGWTGSTCETDIDECSEVKSQVLTSSLSSSSSENELDDQLEDQYRGKGGQNSSALVDEDFLELREESGSLADLCPLNSYCVNKPGWYYCQCRDGFQANLAQNGEAQCQDIDECLLDHPCPRGMTCTNTIGSFKCHCPDENNLLCSPGCLGEDGSSVHPVGSKWFNQECQVCTCATGSEVSCSPPTQSISSDDQNDCPLFCLRMEAYNNKIDNNCCSKCVPPVASAIGLNISSITNFITPPPLVRSTSAPISQQQLQKRCRHQQYSEYEYNSGDIWHFNCQTCECLGGEVDCWPMDCPPTDCPNPVLTPGDCCRRCPAEDDGCSHTFRNLTSNAMHECHLLENTIESGAQITLPHKNCISCKCRDGELCCNYDYYCIANSPDQSLLTSRGI